MSGADRLILIVGLQKTGTSVLFRLLQDLGLAASPFRGEGDAFWGNTPPFSPTAYPAGTLYQRDGDEAGHTLGASDASAAIGAELRRRLGELPRQDVPLVNKNPYNTVRVPWLRALFPDAAIVATVRAAVPTTYSLHKKHKPHEDRGVGPEDGWWGVKPVGWRALRDEDKLAQSARQWAAVTEQLLDARGELDALVPYPRLCAEPAAVAADVARLATGSSADVPPIAPLRCFDDEYRRGSRLLSKNRYYRETGTFETPDSEPIELPALDAQELGRVEQLTAAAEQRLAGVVQLDAAGSR